MWVNSKQFGVPWTNRYNDRNIICFWEIIKVCLQYFTAINYTTGVCNLFVFELLTQWVNFPCEIKWPLAQKQMDFSLSLFYVWKEKECFGGEYLEIKFKRCHYGGKWSSFVAEQRLEISKTTFSSDIIIPLFPCSVAVFLLYHLATWKIQMHSSCLDILEERVTLDLL